MPNILITKIQSTKIRNVMFFNMILVLLLHASAPKLNFVGHESSTGFLRYFQAFVGEGITRVAVPAFFIMSGFLFFASFSNTFSAWSKKLNSRIRTLALPFLMWSTLSFLLLILIKSNGYTSSLVNRSLPVSSLQAVLYTVFNDPIAYQLWFLRDLVLVVFLTTLPMYILLSKHWLYSIPLIGAAFYFNDIFPFQPLSFAYFLLGALIAYRYQWLSKHKIRPFIVLSISIFWIFMCILKAINHVNLLFPKYPIAYEFINVVGCICVWLVWDKVNGLEKWKLWDYAQYSFFLYAVHEPLLTGMKKILFLLLRNIQYYQWAIFILAPIITFIISIFLAKCIKCYLPKSYRLLTGGR